MNILIRSLIQATAFLFMTVLAIMLVYTIGPNIETKFFPVVSNVKVVMVPNEPGEVGLRLLLNSVKQRETCQLVDRLVSVRVGADVWVRATAFFKDEGTDEWVALGKTRPIGNTIVDQVKIRPHGEGLHMVLIHRCHPFWLSSTVQTNLQTLSKIGPQ